MSVVADNFNRANGALGSNWTIFHANALTIVSNQATISANTANFGNRWSANTFSTNQYAQVTMAGYDNAAVDQYIWVLLYASNSAESGYELVASTNPVALSYIQKVVSGTGTILVKQATPTWNQGDILMGTATPAGGGTLTVYRNGVSILTFNDSTFTSGYIGLACYSATPNATNTIMDDFQGGDLYRASKPVLQAVNRAGSF